MIALHKSLTSSIVTTVNDFVTTKTDNEEEKVLLTFLKTYINHLFETDFKDFFNTKTGYV
jgi:hypothetical protein